MNVAEFTGLIDLAGKPEAVDNLLHGIASTGRRDYGDAHYHYEKVRRTPHFTWADQWNKVLALMGDGAAYHLECKPLVALEKYKEALKLLAPMERCHYVINDEPDYEYGDDWRYLMDTLFLLKVRAALQTFPPMVSFWPTPHTSPASAQRS